RGWRPALRVGGFDASTSYPFLDNPSNVFVRSDQLLGLRARMDQSFAFEHGDVRLAIGGTLSRLDERFRISAFSADRDLGFGEIAATARESGDLSSASASVVGDFSGGETEGVSYQRLVAGVAARAAARGLASVDVGATYGQVSQQAADFERF